MFTKVHPTYIDVTFAECSYQFYRVEVKDALILNGQMERTIYCIDGEFTFENTHTLVIGDSIEVSNRDLVLTGSGVVYIAQIPPTNTLSSLKIVRDGAHYKVSKPWGYELWINGENPGYIMKRIFIKAGTQTSLQYHNFKEETNFIESGSISFVYQKDPAPLDEVTDSHLGQMEESAPVSFHIEPKTIHRIKALTDVMLMEVSTPFLDDVVRLQDDAARGNGRISSEHAK